MIVDLLFSLYALPVRFTTRDDFVYCIDNISAFYMKGWLTICTGYSFPSSKFRITSFTISPHACWWWFIEDWIRCFISQKCYIELLIQRAQSSRNKLLSSDIQQLIYTIVSYYYFVLMKNTCKFPTFALYKHFYWQTCAEHRQLRWMYRLITE